MRRISAGSIRRKLIGVSIGLGDRIFLRATERQSNVLCGFSKPFIALACDIISALIPIALLQRYGDRVIVS